MLILQTTTMSNLHWTLALEDVIIFTKKKESSTIKLYTRKRSFNIINTQTRPVVSVGLLVKNFQSE